MQKIRPSYGGNMHLLKNLVLEHPYMKNLVIIFLSCNLLSFSNLAISDLQNNLTFTNVSPGSQNAIAGSCVANTNGNHFGHGFYNLDNKMNWHLISWDHSRSEHCAYHWNGQRFIYDDNTTKQLNTKPTGIGCCGWNVEGIDLDGDGDMDMTGRTTEGDDGWFENKGNGKLSWHRWKYGDRAINYFFDANNDGDFLDNGDIHENEEYLFDSDNDGIPNSVTLNWPKNCPMRNSVFFDLENDKDTDVACFNNKERKLYIAKNQGGTFEYLDIPGYKDIKYSYKGSVAAIDIDNNGFVDPIIGQQAGSPNGGIIIALNNGDETFTIKTINQLSDINFGKKADGRNGLGFYDWDEDCDVDLTIKGFDAISTEPFTLLRNEVGGNCLKAIVKPYDRVIVRQKTSNEIYFSYEYIARNQLSQYYGRVYIGLGQLNPADFSCFFTRPPSIKEQACSLE